MDKIEKSGPSRRFLLAATGGLVAAVAPGSGRAADGSAANAAPVQTPPVEPFHGAHQGGIFTPQQSNSYFAAFDLKAKTREEVIALLKRWTDAAARMSAGLTAEPLGADLSVPPADSGEAVDILPARLTLTFGFGPGLFIQDGKDRYGLAAKRPAAFVDMPRFNGDQLVPANTGGDLSVQACADDPQVAFHAVRQLARLAYGVAEIRWTQVGFASRPTAAPGATGRNLMGFKDGTKNPRTPAEFDNVVWVGAEGPDWMRGGSYLAVRRIRIALEHWDRTPVDFQEEVVGRHKQSGAPIGAKHELDTPDLKAVDKDGNPIIPENSHMRLAMAETNGGAQLLRRAYSYNDGTNITAERWPPWRQGMEFDAGLFFVGYQRDLNNGFVKIFERLAKFDAMNQYTTHVGGGFFACPAGIKPGEYVGQGLFV
jgi:deferrochelatase/peroxidase EfeB